MSTLFISEEEIISIIGYLLGGDEIKQMECADWLQEEFIDIPKADRKMLSELTK